ncbi:methyltransferase N6AMT1-like [Haliotis rufescens]|uniref:methyltransferase N6AMT1-like n=1 Tax=Haliotis rufescens TaxID=6454 RepID=UPI00201F0DC1|nr:methyltransferase N6AMT1-like [Haliotis rufescens]
MSDMFSTPDMGHLGSSDYNHVYEPAEDSFLFLDALEQEHDFLAKLRPTVCLEIGSGSGVCITFLARMLGSSSVYMSTDINVRAACITRDTAYRNSVMVEPVVTDLVNSLASRLAGCVDVLLFNPPYVVTPSQEVGSKGIEASWAGGIRGREVVDRLFPLIPSILSPEGVFYLVIIKENDQDEIEDIMKKNGFQMVVVKSRQSGPEFLSVLKFTWLPSVT